MSARHAAVVVILLVLGLGLQLWFFRHYPQPTLFGDPAGYYDVGRRFQDAARRLAAGEPVGMVFASVRGLFFLLGVGVLFGALDALRPADLGFFREAMAVFNVLAMAGAFLLGRRLAGSFAGGAVALVLAATYATFAVQAGRLYPDPLTGALFVWAAFLYAEAIHRSSPRVMAAAGLVFGAALLVRAQVLEYFVMVIAAVLALTAVRWWRAARGRRLVAALLLGLAPALAAWTGIRLAVGSRDDVIRMGQFTFRLSYPLGFWQHLDTDGWTGPYRFKQDPFYRAMEAEARAGDPDLLRSRAKQVAFTARYVAARPAASLLLVLDNAYRLYDRPANDYKWDYPYPYSVQVAVQRALVVLGAAGMALFAAETPALGGVFLVPVALAVLHGLVFPWPRYNVPAMPIVIAAAGAFLARVARSRPWAVRSVRRSFLTAGGAALVLFGLAQVAWTALPGAARTAALLGTLAGLALPFGVASALEPRARAGLAATAGLTATLFVAHAARDRRWHETRTALGGEVVAVEQSIRLPPAALGRLRSAAEVFVVFDLTVPGGELQRATVEVDGRAFGGGELTPTMPRLRESTATGGRDRRAYPQWWALRLDPAALPATAAEPLRIRLELPAGAEATLRGDRFGGQARTYEGPSFGDWPHWVALKLEYDGDYRTAVAMPLESAGTESFVMRRSGRRDRVAGVHRIRILVPGSNEGWVAWESAPVPAEAASRSSDSRRLALAWAAYSAGGGEAELRVDGAPALRFPLGSRRDFDVAGGRWRLCHRAGPPQDRAYGVYVLAGTAERSGRPLRLSVHYRAGLRQDPMFFAIDRQWPPADRDAAFRRCGAEASAGLDGAASIVDASHNNYPEDTGRWTVAAVY